MDTNNPEWVNAAIRYAVALLGMALAALNLVPDAMWDQIAPALVTFVTVVYGVFRTHQTEMERLDLVDELTSYQ